MDAGPALNPIGVSPSGFAYWHEKGNSADGAILQAFLESTDFYLEAADGGVMVNGYWPDMKNQIGVASMRILGREYPQSNERSYGPFSLPPNLPKKTFRLSTRIARVRYDFASAPCSARGGKPLFDVQPIGVAEMDHRSQGKAYMSEPDDVLEPEDESAELIQPRRSLRPAAGAMGEVPEPVRGRHGTGGILDD